MKSEPPRLKVMVSSTVYGVEDELERIYSKLTSFGYEVWMSHMGTLPVFVESIPMILTLSLLFTANYASRLSFRNHVGSSPMKTSFSPEDC